VRGLRKSETELRQILDLAPQIIGVLGPSRERLYANRVALAYYGVTLEEWRQRSFAPEVHPDDFERVKALVDRSVANPARTSWRCGSGAATDLSLVSGSVQSPPRRPGPAIRWYLACSDIDDRKRTEDRMRNETVALREISTGPRCSRRSSVIPCPATRPGAGGESGAGRFDGTHPGRDGDRQELVARAIHKRSRRASGAFIRVNCAAIPPSLIASELFGHEKGAFTGAVQRRLAGSRRPTAGRSSSMKSVSCRRRRRSRCCASCRSGKSSAVGSSHP